jgi:hypothetical protein
VNYVDSTLTRLADESLRASLFDQEALGQLLAAAYDLDAMAVETPFTAIFDQVVIGVHVPRRLTLEGRWGDISSPERREGRFTVDGFGAGSPVRIDAFWRGAIVARTSLASSRVERVVSAWPDAHGIDDEIVDTLGSLPENPATLETERRSRLIARVRSGLRQPEALDDAAFDRWLRSIGARDVTDVMTRLSNQVLTGALQVEFSAPNEQPPAPRPLAISAAILIRDQPLDVAGLMADSKRMREDLESFSAELTPADAGTGTPLVIWMVPQSVFDDADWPGGEGGSNDEERNRNRRAAAGRWLAREGIGLVTIAPNQPPPPAQRTRRARR